MWCGHKSGKRAALLAVIFSLGLTACGSREKEKESRLSGTVYVPKFTELKLEAEGYKVSVVEYISPLDSPKNLLIRAVRTGHPNAKARGEYEAVTQLLGTHSELDRRCGAPLPDCDWYVTDADLV